MAERMNLISELRRVSYKAFEIRFVDEHNRTTGGFNADVFRTNLAERFFSIKRGDLAATLNRTIVDKAELMFDDSITALTDDGAGVSVTFQKQSPRRFYLVVAADGLHSAVRSLQGRGMPRPFPAAT